MNTKAASKILDDAREKAHKALGEIHLEIGTHRHNIVQKVALPPALCDKIWDTLKAISGTTDIECPECVKGMVKIEKPAIVWNKERYCSNCHGIGVIKHKWKIAVVLENGELPVPDITTNFFPCNEICHKMEQQNMLNVGWVKEVKQVVE